MNKDLYLIYITCSSLEEAKKIAHALVEENLVACANILPAMHSIYKWQGKLAEDTEFLLLAKTAQRKFAQLQTRVKQLHRYECPCIVALPIADVNEEYASWLDATLN